MERLTVKGFVWKGTSNFRNIGRWSLAECLNRLSEYEDTGLTPDEINALRERGINDGWISADERLPEENTAERYIITDTGGCIWSEMWYGYVEESDDAPCFYRWDDDMWQCFKIHAIAWRPLPEPYRPENVQKKK